MRYFSIIVTLAAVMFTACSSKSGDQNTQVNPENLSKKVDQLIKNDKYDDALTLLDNQSSTQDASVDLDQLREKTYLNYGLYLEYRGGDTKSMRDRMTGALRNYIEVLKINRQNQKALSEVKQIMGIYNTMPNKSAPDDIKQELDQLGVSY